MNLITDNDTLCYAQVCAQRNALRAEVERLRDGERAADAEIMRLRSKVKEWADLAIDHVAVIGKLHAEVDWLRGELEEAKVRILRMEQMVQVRVNEIAKQIGELG